MNHKIILLGVVFGCGTDICMEISKLWVQSTLKNRLYDHKILEKFITFDHFDHVTEKVDRCEPVQVIRMGMTPSWLVIFTHLCPIWPFWWPERVHPGPILLLHGRNDQIRLLYRQKWLEKVFESSEKDFSLIFDP